ncbi:MAG: hypothetical protein GY805_20715, partial [Chloroflexi bacterium]|nr:hypothetical protein [Chloroflexota bacterium]
MITVLTQEKAEVSIKTEAKLQVQTPKQLVQSLLALPDFTAQQQFLATHIPNLNEIDQDEIADLLKEKSDHFLRSDIQQCLNTAELILYLADLTNNPLHRALGLGAKGNPFGHGGLGEYQRAIDLYEQARQIYEKLDNSVYQAVMQYGKLVPLANLGHYDKAFDLGQWIRAVFEENNEWLWLAKLHVNLGVIYNRL